MLKSEHMTELVYQDGSKARRLELRGPPRDIDTVDLDVRIVRGPPFVEMDVGDPVSPARVAVDVIQDIARAAM